MYRPIISLIMIAVVVVLMLLASGIVKVEIDIQEREPDIVKKKTKKTLEIDKISEAEVVKEDDAKNEKS